MRECLRQLLYYLNIAQSREVKANRSDYEDISWVSYKEEYRYNPWNPLSYLAILIITPFAIHCLGLEMVFRDLLNVFKWEE